MKKVIALAMTVLLLLVLTVPTFAVEANTATVLYKANQIVDPNMLMMRAELGIDERSTTVKEALDITVRNNKINTRSATSAAPEMFTTTQLTERKLLQDGSIEETYSTVGVTRSSLSDMATDTQNSVTVYAVVNYTTRLVDYTLVEARYDGSEHRVVYPSAVDTYDLERIANIDDGIDSLYRNTRTIASPSNGTWYGLNSPSSSYFSLKFSFIAYTAVQADNGAAPEASCEVDLHWVDP